MLRPGINENEVVAAAMKLLFELGSEHVEAINAISGDRCNPHPHTFCRPAAPAGRPGVLRHHPLVHGLPDVLLPHVQRRLRDALAARRLPAVPRVARRCDRPRPARRDDGRDRRAVWPTAKEIGMPDEHAAFGLQFGHGLGVGLYEFPMISRLHSLEAPVELEVGMVFALETYCPATDGRSAARIEEEVVVTPTGPAGAHALPGRGAARHREDVRPRSRPAERPGRAGEPRESEPSRRSSAPSRLTPASVATRHAAAGAFEGLDAGLDLYRRMLLIRRLRGARPVALPARRGLRHDASLLGAGGGRRSGSRARSVSGDRVACTYRGHGHLLARGLPSRRRCSPSCSAAPPASTAAAQAR